MGFGHDFKMIEVYSQLLRFLFFFLKVHFSKLEFNCNQEEGINPVVLCTIKRCNRAIAGEKVLYFTSHYVFYCLVWFSSKTLVGVITALSLRGSQVTVSGQMQKEEIILTCLRNNKSHLLLNCYSWRQLISLWTFGTDTNDVLSLHQRM